MSGRGKPLPKPIQEQNLKEQPSKLKEMSKISSQESNHTSAKTTNVVLDLEPKEYNLRSKPLASKESEEIRIIPKPQLDDDDIFKKPDIKDLTVGNLMIGSSNDACASASPIAGGNPDLKDLTVGKLVIGRSKDACASPVTGGNLMSRIKTVVEELPQSPPSSTSTSNDLSSRLKDFDQSNQASNSASKNLSILKSNSASIENLESYENLRNRSQKPLNSKPTAVMEKLKTFKSCDAKFMPVTLTRTGEYLYVSSQAFSQVQVFKNESYQGVLKINDDYYFDQVRCVHAIPDPNNQDQIWVLDNKGFHQFTDKGMYVKTIFQDKGYFYRGLSHAKLKGKLCLITAQIDNSKEDSGHNDDPGVDIIAIDLTSMTFNSEEKGTDPDIIRR